MAQRGADMAAADALRDPDVGGEGVVGAVRRLDEGSGEDEDEDAFDAKQREAFAESGGDRAFRDRLARALLREERGDGRYRGGYHEICEHPIRTEGAKDRAACKIGDHKGERDDGAALPVIRAAAARAIDEDRLEQGPGDVEGAVDEDAEQEICCAGRGRKEQRIASEADRHGHGEGGAQAVVLRDAGGKRPGDDADDHGDGGSARDLRAGHAGDLLHPDRQVGQVRAHNQMHAAGRQGRSPGGAELHL